MNLYSSKPLPFWNLLGYTFRTYSTIIKNSWWLILIVTLFDPMNIFSAKFLNAHINGFVILLALIIFWLLSIFISAIILHENDMAFADKQVVFQKSYANAKTKFLALLGGFILVALLGFGAAIVAGVFYFLVYLILSSLVIGKVISLIVFLIIVYFTLFLLIFVLPLIVLEPIRVMDALKKGLELSWNNKWRIFGILLIISALVFSIMGVASYFVSPDNFLGTFLMRFIVKFLSYPLFISSILLLLHDSKLHLES